MIKYSTPSSRDLFLWWAVNVSASFFMSGSHNVLYFVSDIRTPVIHFMHYASTTVFMVLLLVTGFIPKIRLPLHEFIVPVGCKFLETILSSIVHSQNRTGGLYTLRIFDFVSTWIIVQYGHRFIETTKTADKPTRRHLMALALSASLCWLEFGQMEYTTFSLLCSPLLSAVRALSILTMWRCYQRVRPVQFELFVLHYCTLCSVVLSLPALISFSTRDVKVTASWESIDFVLLYLSPLFMSCLQFSEMWMAIVAGPRHFAVAEHTKYFGASIGQWFIQNMAHPNILALCGKILFVAAWFRMWTNQFV